MNLPMIMCFIATTLALGPFSQRWARAQSLRTVNIATAAAGQSGYIAALIDAKGIAANMA